jgi:hypothetical protein
MRVLSAALHGLSGQLDGRVSAEVLGSVPQQRKPTMAGVVFPPGISHAASHAPSLIEKTPAPPGPVPIPFPNIAAHFATQPAVAVLQTLFEPADIDVLGIAPHNDSFVG